jgi:leucine dehydrogenase
MSACRPTDLVATRRTTRYVAGLEGHAAASGDPSPVTAEGVFRGVRLCVQRALNRDLNGVTVAIQGVGHVGAYLAEKLHAAGARLIVADVNQQALSEVAARTGAQIVSTGTRSSTSRPMSSRLARWAARFPPPPCRA